MPIPNTSDETVKTRPGARQTQPSMRLAIRQMLLQQQLEKLPDPPAEDDDEDDTDDKDDPDDGDDKDEDDGDDKDDKDKKKPKEKPDNTPRFTQADLDRIAKKVRDDVTNSFNKKLTKEKETASANALREKGEFKTLYEQEQAKVTALETRITELELGTLKATIGAEFKLTPKMIKRLQGTTEDELRADAAELQKEVRPAKPDPENGAPRQNKKTEAEIRAQERAVVTKSPRYRRM